MDPITCHACGRQNSHQSRFCQQCGTALSTAAGPSGATSGATPKATPGATSGSASGAEVPPTIAGVNAPLPPATRLRDRYVIQRQLGQGGFGRTYLAEDTGRFNTPIVLKELTPSVQGTYALKKAEELFQREAETLHRLEHPQIPRFWEIFQAQKRLFLVEDCVAGQTYQALLEARQQQGQVFSEVEIVQLFRDLLPVLVYLHGEGIVHRDISPDNIMRRDKDGLPVLIDLGGVKQMALDIATQMAQQPTQSSSSGGTRLGKVGYAPDEQMRLGLVAPHSDLYALAVTALVLMTGKSPPALQDPNSLEWVWQRELTLNPRFTQVLNRMLGPRPIDRFQSAGEVLQALNSIDEVPPTRMELSVPTATVPETVVPATVPSNLPDSRPTQVDPLFSANTSGQGADSIVPAEVKGWNWGAFFLPGCWCLTNQVWIGLLAWPGLLVCGLGWLVMGILLGASGNEWAWRSRPWRTVDAFKSHQRGWAIGGLVTTGLLTLLVIAAALSDPESKVADDSSTLETPTATKPSSPNPSTDSSSPSTSSTGRTFDFQPVRINSLTSYTHPQQVFSLQVPAGWKLKDTSKSGEVIINWTDPTRNGALVADIFDVDYDPTQDDLTTLLETFLEDTFSDEPDFFLEEPNPQKDGSVLLVWGYTGTATGNIKIPLLGNSFIERQGDRIAILTFVVPSEQFKDLEGSLNKIINTYQIDTAAKLPE